MRVLEEFTLKTNTGAVGVCDGSGLNDDILDVSICLEVLPGHYKLYQRQVPEMVVFDGAPNVLRAGSRPELIYFATITVDSRFLVIAEASILPVVKLGPPFGCSAQFSSSCLKVWVEEKENSKSKGCPRILGIGPKAHLLLAGTDADQIHTLEKKAATALRLKGPAGQALVQDLRAEVLELHLAGSKDPRLGMLASAIKLKLPHRGRLGKQRD